MACILYTHCTRCHNNTQSIAAIPFTNYNEAYANRNAIKYYVENKLMPPYQPSTENNHYIHDKTLTQTEIDLIKAWVNQGSLKGDTTLAPSAPIITPLVSQIPFPDFSQRIPPYTVPNTVGFKYHCFVLPITYTTEKHISLFEVLPTDLSAIYNVFVYSDTSSIPIALDFADTSNGYENYGGTGSPTAKLLYGWVNGNPLYKTPPNMALRLDANAHIVVRLLIAEDAMNKIDSTQINLKFDTSSTARIIDVTTLLHQATNLQNPPFIIPADSVKTFYEQYIIPSDISILSVSHWAQKFCSNMNCFAVTPANDTIHLLQIEDHEDLWSQGNYYLKNPIKIPANSILFGEAEFDNTSLNPNQPFNPTHNIIEGLADTSEQMQFSFSYLPYQINDENIIVDTVEHQLHYLNCSPAHNVPTGLHEYLANQEFGIIYPNPASDFVYIDLKQNNTNIKRVTISDMVGKQVMQTEIETNHLDISVLPNGQYILTVYANGQILHSKIIKQ